MDKIIENVEIEELYQHILNVEGIRNPINTPKKLNEVADYIKTKFEEYGLEVSEHHFKIDGFDITFRNIEGYIGNGKDPEILVTCHYDSLINSPGANDNGSGIAAMLEAARILAKEKKELNVRFVAFTLEEFNPTKIKKSLEYAKELGLVDSKYRFLTYNTMELVRDFHRLRFKLLSKSRSLTESYDDLLELDINLTKQERKFLEFLKELYSDDSKATWIGNTGLIGSSRWVEKALKEGKEIIGVINLETIGYTSNKKRSQFLPPLINPLLFPSYKINPFQLKGNFISIVANKNSKRLAREFSKQCRSKKVKLPYFRVRLPFKFETILKFFADTMRSDHAPFWRANIPALMITDSANFRNPYYHTEADTIDKLDFEFIKKVTQVTIATTIEMLR
jgi:hypothetical protein